jgi:hypothetical protein
VVAENQALAMDQPSESPLTPLGLQVLQETSQRHDTNLAYPITDVAPWTFLIWLIGPFCAGNFLIGPLIAWFDYSVAPFGIGITTCAAISIGCIPLQVVVLSYYAVFSNEDWWLRLAISVGLVALCSAVGLLGMSTLVLTDRLRIGENEIEGALQFLCLVPLVAFSAQLPFWPLRIFLGWQFVPVTAKGTETVAPREPQSHFSILQLMVATATVSVVLGLLRIAPVERTDTSEFWSSCGLFAFVAASMSLLGGIPLILCFTGLKSRWLAFGLAVGVPAAIGWSIAGYLATWLNPGAQRQLFFVTSMITVVGLTFVLGIAASLFLLRMHSWTIGRPAKST